ncbi:MAG: hypothetical protein ACR2RF_00050 [Geminicoccaceae bacterium]
MAEDDFTMPLRISDRTAPKTKKWLLAMPSGQRAAAVRAVLEDHMTKEGETAGWAGHGGAAKAAPEGKGWPGLKEGSEESKSAKLESRVDLDID